MTRFFVGYQNRGFPAS